jgi:uncharacterized protein (DUF58 family)
MAPTPLLISILLAATPLLWLGFHDARFPALGLGIMGGALLIAIADNLLSRRTTTVELTRDASETLSLGAPNRISIQVRSRCPRPLALIVKDDPPPDFHTPDRAANLRLAPFETARVGYATTPRQRGDFHFGRLHVRVRSRLRLSWWQRSFPAAAQVRVYPDIQQVRKWEALARRGRLQDAGLRSRIRGEGTEFESLRDYVPDDSFRDIDWKATAKRGRPITRQFQTERNQSLVILLDSGRMMAAPIGADAPGGDLTRLDLSINAALMLAHVAATMGDAVGMLTFSDRIKSFVPPGKGRQQTRRILEELYALQAEMTEPDYRAATTYLRTRSRKRSLVVAFTDLVDTEVSAQVLAYLAALAPQHLPMVVTVRDQGIEELREQTPSDALHVYEKALAGRALEERELALARLRQRGAYVCDARPDDLVAATVNQYLAIKRRGVL